jgi:hypothetical protein
MMDMPFDVISCSWPRPVEQADGRWTSEPEWDAPVMPSVPQPRWERVQNEWCWMINWRDLFKSGLKAWDARLGGEMRGFQIVFRLRIHKSGRLIFWADDGCIIRCNGAIIHCDRSAHSLARSEIEVTAGDLLEVAQWQFGWDWLWGAQLCPSIEPFDAVRALTPYLEAVQERLRHPDGPPLKLYTSGAAPVRTVLAIYSLALNGYAPPEVYLFGESDWPARARDLFATLLPFARITSTDQVLGRLRSLGGSGLADLAQQHWFVMKLCVGLFHPPDESCVMDDDVFVLGRLDDALDAFRTRDLVFAPDQDVGAGYLATWGRIFGQRLKLPTARCSAWLYWIRPVADPRWLAAQALRVRPDPRAPYLWEQGFIALAYAQKNVVELPSQRYLFALFQGLPGGMLGYDYAHNPCGFASIHFGGLMEKPPDDVALQLAPAILGLSQGSA